MRRPILLAALLFMSACPTQIEGRFLTTNAPHRPMAPRAPETVQLFTSGHPNVPYVEIGVIEERLIDGAPDDTLVALLAHMREDGGRYGCDAVVVGGDAEEPTAKAGRESPEFWGTCIQYVQK